MAKLKEPIIATIDHYTKKGDGYCYLQGKFACHVVGGAAGDRGRLRIVARKRKCYIAKMEEVLDPSPERVPFRCAHGGDCGGCRLQHVNYDAQLEHKQELLIDLFCPYYVNYIEGCDEPWRYRNKMEFTFGKDRHGERLLGLIEAGSKGIVINLKECHICAPEVIAIMDAVRAWWRSTDLPPYHHYSGKGVMRSLTVRRGERTGSCQVMLTVAAPLTPDQKSALQGALSPFQVGLFINHHCAEKGVATEFKLEHLEGDERLHERLEIGPEHSLDLYASPHSFLQPNTRQAEKILRTAIELLSLTGGERLLDLYSGVGTIGLGLSRYVKEVIAIELIDAAAQDAAINAKANGIENIRPISCDVKRALHSDLRSDLVGIDIVVVDPPREGLDGVVIEALLEMAPAKILYISCNPKTQAEDLKGLAKAYRIDTLQPIDQFPHTVHMENIALLIQK